MYQCYLCRKTHTVFGKVDEERLAYGRVNERYQPRIRLGVFEQATVLELARLLTVVIRSDRFGEGALAVALESGLVTAVLRRIEQLRREE